MDVTPFSFKRIIAATLIGVWAILFIAYATLQMYGWWYDDWSGYNASLQIGDGRCNIAVLPIRGTIVPYEEESEGVVTTNPDYVRSFMRAAEADPTIAGVLLRIDSGGGAPVASETIARVIHSSPLFSAALIGELGASGAYLVAAGADTIFASPLSDVGGIGVTMSYVQQVEANEKEGYEFISLSSGKYKDYMDPNKPLTEEERSLLERDLKIYHEAFVEKVAELRDMPVEKVRSLADGATLPASLALEQGLIDYIGSELGIREWFAFQLEIEPDEVIFCE